MLSAAHRATGAQGLWKDLDNFVGTSARRYGFIIRAAVNASSAPPPPPPPTATAASNAAVLLAPLSPRGLAATAAAAGIPSPQPVVVVPLGFMIYDGPVWIYESIGPYADLFITSTTASKLLQIYEAAATPVVDTDYTTATPDSAMWAAGTIDASTLTYNSTTDRTQAVVSDFGFVKTKKNNRK